MYDLVLRGRARQLAAEGLPQTAIASRLGVSQSAVSRWLRRALVSDHAPPIACWLCDDRLDDLPATAYGYLLGQYLGDGHLVTRARVPVLRIYACFDYPAMTDEIADTITAVRGSPPARMRLAQTDRGAKVQSYWKHWPCLFPQHGPGRKHERPIVLAAWQQEIVDADPWPLIRGLIHSDGCRAINRVRTRGTPYEYPRYFFANESADILAIMGTALDRVGVAWRFNRPNSISIARREAVGLMDEHIGPKR